MLVEKGVLFRGEYKDFISCPKCGAPWYKDEVNKLYPVKILRHFPIIPRFQRMFRMFTMLFSMLWHAQNNSPDGLIRHPCDSKAWKHVMRGF